MINEKLKPYVLWGQHRTTELLAMNIKELLINDNELDIPFIEFEKYEISDYVPILYALHEANKKGEDWNKLRIKLSQEESAYEKELIMKYGHFLFNLHDGIQLKGWSDHYNIEFWIPRFIKEQDVLKNYLFNVSKRHDDVEIVVRCFKEGRFTVNNPNLVVEFMLPEAIAKNYSSKEIEELDYKFGVGKIGFAYAKTPDTSNPLFNETVKKYGLFMKDVLSGVNKLKITKSLD